MRARENSNSTPTKKKVRGSDHFLVVARLSRCVENDDTENFCDVFRNGAIKVESIQPSLGRDRQLILAVLSLGANGFSEKKQSNFRDKLVRILGAFSDRSNHVIGKMIFLPKKIRGIEDQLADLSGVFSGVLAISDLSDAISVDSRGRNKRSAQERTKNASLSKFSLSS